MGERAETAVSTPVESTAAETDKPLPSRPVSLEAAVSESQAVPDEESRSAARKAKQADPVLKKRPSFASLRKSGVLTLLDPSDIS